jgi:hypothetical protein
MAKTPRIHTRQDHPDFVDLDWTRPIREWTTERLVEMPTGIHRHDVVFVAYEEGIYAIKELAPHYAQHEFEILRSMEGRTRHTAIAVGHVLRPWVDPHEEWAGAVITAYVTHAFPYRSLISGIGFGTRRDALLDAFAGLLVELHLHGLFWGDCSLSNILYKWDASSIEAIMIDAETSRIHEILSGGQRREDLEIMTMNVAGEMADIAAQQGVGLDDADMELGSEITSRYHGLWKELTTSLVVTAGDHYRIRQRIDRLHGLGFAVEEIDLIPVDNGTNVKIRVKVGGRQYHSERLREITGIDISENQARAILSDLAYHEAKLGGTSSTGKSVAAIKWRARVFEPMILEIDRLLPERDPYQAYCDYLAFRLAMATERDEDIPNAEAFAAWTELGFPGLKEALKSDPPEPSE